MTIADQPSVSKRSQVANDRPVSVGQSFDAGGMCGHTGYSRAGADKCIDAANQQKDVAVPMPLEEISEVQADAATGAIYDDIKRASGTPLVNLIYRHLATMPGMLEWAWDNISRNDGYAKLSLAAARLPRHRLCRALPASAWRLAGLSDDDIAAMARLVEGYNKTNAINLIAVTCLLRAVPQSGAGTTAVEPKASDAGAGGSASEASQTEVQSVRSFLNQLVAGGQPGIEPTMFRNFERWPPALAMASAILAPLAATGALEAARSASVDAARRIGDELAAQGFDMRPLEESALSSRVASTLSLFQRNVIGAMLPVGHALGDTLG